MRQTSTKDKAQVVRKPSNLFAINEHEKFDNTDIKSDASFDSKLEQEDPAGQN